MRFVAVMSAVQTANPSILDLVIRVDPEDGSGEQDWGFGYNPLDDDGLTPEVENFFFDHPDFPIGPYVPPPPTADQIAAERERRIALPLEVTLSVGTITINMDPHAQRNIQGLASVGQYLVATSSSDTTAFRDYDNTSHDLTPADLVAMGLQVAQRIQAVYAKSWAIKAMDPIPADYADDAWWT